jgi:hypothetical protein
MSRMTILFISYLLLWLGMTYQINYGVSQMILLLLNITDTEYHTNSLVVASI